MVNKSGLFPDRVYQAIIAAEVLAFLSIMNIIYFIVHRQYPISLMNVRDQMLHKPVINYFNQLASGEHD